MVTKPSERRAMIERKDGRDVREELDEVESVLPRRLGDRLYALRRDWGWRQRETAERIGVSRRQLARWEAGEQLPPLAKLARLAAVYGVSLSALFREPEEAPPPVATSLGQVDRLLVTLRETLRAALAARSGGPGAAS